MGINYTISITLINISPLRRVAGLSPRPPLSSEKVEVDQDDQGQAGQGHQDPVHQPLLRERSSRTRLKRSEFVTTETELKAMAAEAIMGLSRTPNKG